MAYNPFLPKLKPKPKPSSTQDFYDVRSYEQILGGRTTKPVGYPSYYGQKPTAPRPSTGGRAGFGGYGPLAYQGGFDPTGKSGWTTDDWEAYARDQTLNPPTPTEGVFFNPNIPRSDVFMRDDENRIVFDEQGRPVYRSTEFSDYMEREGVKIAWPGGVGTGNVPRPGRWTDWMLGKLGYGYGDRGINPYAAPQVQAQPPPQGDYYAGGGYGGGYRGGGGGGGYTPSSYTRPQYSGGTRPYPGYTRYNPDTDWFGQMVKWRMGG